MPADAVGHYLDRRRAAHGDQGRARAGPGREGHLRARQRRGRRRPAHRRPDLSRGSAHRERAGHAAVAGATAGAARAGDHRNDPERPHGRRDAERGLGGQRRQRRRAGAVRRQPAGGDHARRCRVWGGRWRCGSRPTACGRPSSSTVRRGRRSTSARSSRAEDGTVALRDLRQVAPSLSRVVDVAWRDSRRLFVLAGDARQDRIVPYEVGVDGFGLTSVSTSGLPSQPTAIAAAPLRQPLVIAGGTDLAAGGWYLGHPGPRCRAAARNGAVLPHLTEDPVLPNPSPARRGARIAALGCRGGQSLDPRGPGRSRPAPLLRRLRDARARCCAPVLRAARLAARRRPAAVPVGVPADGRRRRLRRTGPARGRGLQGARPRRARGTRSERRWRWPSRRWSPACRAPAGRCSWCRCPARRRRCAAAGGTTSGSCRPCRRRAAGGRTAGGRGARCSGGRAGSATPPGCRPAQRRANLAGTFALVTGAAASPRRRCWCSSTTSSPAAPRSPRRPRCSGRDGDPTPFRCSPPSSPRPRGGGPLRRPSRWPERPTEPSADCRDRDRGTSVEATTAPNGRSHGDRCPWS